MMAPLSGYRVLDLSRVLAGPWAGQTLADLGAEVIKVERPGRGDDTRHWGPPYLKDSDGQETSESAYYLCANRGKDSLTVDITQPEGQAIIRQLAAESDVLLENFKVGDLARYGLDYSSLQTSHPHLVYCSITGFGQDGPYARRAGYDFLIQAMGGLMSITGDPEGTPQKVGVAVADVFTGLYAAIAIQAALLERQRSGQGQWIDLALLDVQAAVLANQASNHLVGGLRPGRLGNAHPNIVPYQAFAARDGHLILAVGNDRQFSALSRLLGHPKWAEDPRFAQNAQRVAHRESLCAAIAECLSKQDKAHWIRAMEAEGIPCGPINDLQEVYNDPQIRHRGMRLRLDHPLNSDLELPGNPIHFSRTPTVTDRAPPRLGEHSEQILRERLGYSDGLISTLKRKGVI